MESFKNPATIASIAAITGLFGAVIYFYKRANGLQSEIDKLTEHIASIARKVGELKDTNARMDALTNALAQLSNQANHMTNQVREIKEAIEPINDEIEDIHFILDGIVDAFAEQDITIDTTRPKRRRGGRIVKPKQNPPARKRKESESDSEDEPPVRPLRHKPKPKPKPTKKPNKRPPVDESSETGSSSDADIKRAVESTLKDRSKNK